MDEFDPASRDAPPARHLVESDSEDDEGDFLGNARGSIRAGQGKARPFRAPRVEVSDVGASTSKLQPGAPLVLLVGAVGEAYVRAQAVPSSGSERHVWTSSKAVMVGGEQQGAVHIGNGGSVVALLRPDGATMARQQYYAYLGSALFQQLQPSGVVIVDSYNASLYLADETVRRSEEAFSPDALIRFVHGDAPALPALARTATNDDAPRPFASPNYLTGLGAALLCESNARGLPTTMILVPQEQSGAPNPHLHAAQQSSSAGMADAEESSTLRLVGSETQPGPLTDHLNARLQRLLSKMPTPAQASAADGPPLDAFLQARRAAARKQTSSDVSAMYM